MQLIGGDPRPGPVTPLHRGGEGQPVGPLVERSATRPGPQPRRHGERLDLRFRTGSTDDQLEGFLKDAP